MKKNDWSKPSNNMQDWTLPAVEEKRRMDLSNVNPYLLGFLQNIGEQGRSLNEMEVPVPETFKPEKLRHPENIPEFSLEQYVNPDDILKFNIGRYGPQAAALGYGAVKGLGALAKPLTSKAIGKQIVGDVKSLKSGFNKEYNAFFDKAEKSGLGKLNISESTLKDMSDVLENVTDKKYYHALEKAINNPTARNVHFAQSDLGKFIRKWKDKKDIPTPIHDALKAANNAQNALKGDLYSAFMNKGGLELPFEYAQLSEKYAKNLVPYLENMPIRRASLKPGQKGYIRPERLPQKLKLESSDPFMAHLRQNIEGTKIPLNAYLKGKYPLLGVNQMLTSPLVKYGLAPLGAASGTYELWKMLMEGG